MQGSITYKDINDVLKDNNIPWQDIDGKSILITGATGLIGSILIKTLATYVLENKNKTQIIALVRSEEKAHRIFKDYIKQDGCIQFLVGNVEEPISYGGKIDYIIHAASQTESIGFANQPLETIRTAICGTENMLKLAVEKNVLRFIYLSSMEVYGTPETDEKIYESHPTNLDTMSIRNCYPESKRMCENLCVCYSKEYGISTSVVRLTQTFGAGIHYDDKRVFAEFARCAIEKRNIVLNTAGDTKRNYLYTADAVRAILCVLLKGENGQAYNAANEDTYCSIYEMACMVAEDICSHTISVERHIASDIEKFGYAPTLHMNLDTTKLQSLGWKPKRSLYEMFHRMIEVLVNEKEGE